MNDVAEKKLPWWVQWAELNVAEDFKRRHEKIFFIKMLITWDEYLDLSEDHPEMQIFEQKDGDAWVQLQMTPFEFFDYSAWYYMDKHQRAKRECAYCGNTIFTHRNKAFCSFDHWTAYMRRDFRKGR